MTQKTKERQKNLDELRALAMMMVVVLHFLGKGNLLGDVTSASMDSVGFAAWVLEAFCIVAVNCYMLLSGYFLCETEFQFSRLFKLYLQVWIYSVGIGILAATTGFVPAAEVDTHYYLTLLFPVSMGHYWFMTAYLFLYVLLPVAGTAVKHMDRAQLRRSVLLLLAVFCVLKSVLPFRLEEDSVGYDVVWYLCVFLLAAYIRKYGLQLLNKRWRCACLYLGGCVLILAELFVLRAFYLRSGSFGLILKVSFEYNHVFALAAALGLFGFFLHGKGAGLIGTVAEKLSPYVLGVYLLHENIGVRYGWQQFFHAEEIRTVPELLLWTVLAALCMFAAGVAVEWLRSFLVKALSGANAEAAWKR